MGKLFSNKYFSITIIIIVVVAAYSTYMNKKTSVSKDTLRVAILGEPGSLDPHYASGVWEHAVIADIFTGLFEKDAKGFIKPSLVADYKVSSDGKIYTFYLKEALWSDGKAIAAEDFVYSYRRILDPETAAPYSSILYIIKGAAEYNADKTKVHMLAVKALDTRTLEIHLNYPASYFVSMLTHYAFFPVPKHAIDKHGKAWTKAENIVSNGAYKLVDWKPQNYIKATKNDQFWDAPNTQIPNVIYYTQEDRSAVLKRFRAGEINIADDFSSDQYEWLKQNMAEEAIISPYMGIYYFSLNILSKDNPALGDPKVRNALSMAVDREFITEKISKSGEIPAYSFVPTGISGYSVAEVTWKSLSKDDRLKKAKELLKEAGFDKNNPLKLKISYNTSENHKKIVVAISSMWKDLGVEVTNINSEVAVHYKGLQDGDYQVGRAGWIADYEDPASFLYVAETGVTNNYARYSNKDFDRLFNAAKNTVDTKERNALYRQAEEIMLADMPYIPIYYYVSRSLVGKDIGGWHPNVANIHQSRFIYFK